MDINNDLQQINTFVKGMNTDVSDALMDSSQYRYAENVRLATNTEENTGELRLVEGTEVFANMESYGVIDAMTSVRNLLIIVTRTSDSDYIFVKDTQRDDSNFKMAYKTGDNGERFGPYLSLVTRWENKKDIKLYIADAQHSIIYINLYNALNDQCVVGIEGVKSDVNVTLNPITVSLSSSGGTIPPAKVQYSYRLYKEGGTATGLCPLSNIITLYDGEKGYRDTIEYSDKAVDIKIQPLQDTTLDHLQIYRLLYKQQGQQPSVNLIYDNVFVSEYTDTGQNIQSTSFEEFIAMFDHEVRPKIIESKGDYLFAANMTYEQDDIDKILENENFRIYSYGDYINGQIDEQYARDYNIQFERNNIKEYNQQYWLKPFSDPAVIGGIGTYIDWEQNVKYYYYTQDNKKYENYDSNTHTLSNQTFDSLQSLRQGEVYRYGAIFYDNKGGKSSAKWLCDIMAPVLPGNGGFASYMQPSGEYVFRIPIIGVTFHVKQLPAGFSAVEIVRCKRTQNDKISLVQGIAGFPYRIWSRTNADQEFQDKNTICAPYVISTNKFSFDPDGSHDDYNLSKAESDNSKLVIANPEYTYQPDDIENLLQNKNISVKPIRGLSKQTELLTYSDVSLTNEDIIKSVDIRDEQSAAIDHSNRFNAKYSTEQLTSISPKSNYWHVVQDENNVTWKYDQLSAFYTAYTFDKGSNYPISQLYQTHNIPNISLYDIKYHMASAQSYSIPQEPVNVYKIAFTKAEGGASKDSLRSQFLVNGDPNYLNSSVNVGGKQYINWSVPLLYGQQSSRMKDDVYKGMESNWHEELIVIMDAFPALQPSGSTGRYILADLGENTIPFSNTSDRIQALIVNLRNENAVPYGGKATTGMSQYMSYGSYKVGIGVDIQVFDGDCYPGVFEFNMQHAWFSPEIFTVDSRSYNGIRQAGVCYAPIESDIDLSATYGDLYSRLNSSAKYYIQDVEDSFDGFTQSNPAYLYNTAYNIEPDNIKYSSISYTSVSDNDFDTRVYHSNLKTNGETIDSWLSFSPNNYIDVDSRFGKITNLRLFKDKLLFWQERATGILSVNERTVLNDIENNDIVVGTGGTLQRYDYISTVYGMKPNQYEAETQSNVAQYWWDGNNKEILVYGGGMELVPLTKSKGVTNYINQREESKHPMLAYDTKYDEVLSQVVNDETLVYNEQIQAFSSVYTFAPQYRTYIENNLYLANGNYIYIQNRQGVDGYSYLFDKPAFPKVRIVVNKNNIYTKTFDNLTFGGRMYKGSLQTIANWQMERVPGEYVKDEHLNSPMHHLTFTFETPLKQKSAIRGDKATSVDEYDYRLAIPRNGSQDSNIEYGNRMRGKTMQCEMASDYNSTDFSLQYITTKFRMSWS